MLSRPDGSYGAVRLRPRPAGGWLLQWGCALGANSLGLELGVERRGHDAFDMGEELALLSWRAC